MEKVINVINLVHQQNTQDAVIYNGEVFTFKASGNTRRVFVNKDKTLVVKIPTESQYQRHNDSEADLHDPNNPEHAATSKIENGWVVQEYLHTFDDPETDTWFSDNFPNRLLTKDELLLADSSRNDVGFDSNGVLKVYDIEEYRKY